MHDPRDMPSRGAGWPPTLDARYERPVEIGRGATSVVFRARERETEQWVAIKIVHAHEATDADAIARFMREARIIHDLVHPNVVRLYGVEALPDTSWVLVMQHVEGQTLRDELADGPLSSQRAERILTDATRALAYAHRCRVVHRDVKPENIFLDVHTDRALLADFGIATRDEADDAQHPIAGTPPYMSPEQVRGSPLDGRSDLYSLGLVAWEMLTGERPWAGESLHRVLHHQQHDPLPPIDQLREDVPPRLQFLVEGLLAKNPEHRWQSATRMLALLASPEDPPGYRKWLTRSWRRSAEAAPAARRSGASDKARVDTLELEREAGPPAPAPRGSLWTRRKDRGGT